MKRPFLNFFCCIVIWSAISTQVLAEPITADSEKSVFNLGLIPEQNIFNQFERYRPIAEYLSANMELDVKLKVLTRYGNIVDNFIEGELDGAFFGSFSFALAYSKLGVEVLVRPEFHDGKSSYYGMIFTRKDSGINNAADMKGKSFAFVDRATTAGYLLPLAYFQDNGIGDHSTYLGEIYFTGTHEDTIYDVFNGKADIGAAKNTIFFKLVESDSRMFDALKVLTRSPDVPANGFAVRKDLAQSIKKRLKAALLGMHQDPEGQLILKKFGANKFIDTTLEDYQPVFDYSTKIGLDLSTYDYLNE